MLLAKGCLLDDEKAKLYSNIVNKGYAARFAFASAIFGEASEAFFWLQLPCATSHVGKKIANKSPAKHFEEPYMPSKTTSKGPSSSRSDQNCSMVSYISNGVSYKEIYFVTTP